MIIRRGADPAHITIIAYAIASIIMTVIATFIVLEQRWIMPALAAEMAALDGSPSDGFADITGGRI